MTFSKAGTYTLKLTSTTGTTVVSASYTFTVVQTLTSISMSPASFSIFRGGARQLAGTALDQFRAAMSVQPSFTWTISSGIGSVSASGLYSAPSGPSGTAKITVKAGTISATATATVVTALTNGVSVSGLSGATGSQQFFGIVIPSGKAKLTISISGGTGDANLYLRLSSLPSTTTYTARSIFVGNADSIPLTFPAAGTYYVLLYGNAAFSGVTIKAVVS